MSDIGDTKPPAPLPEPFHIPRAILEAWLKIPAGDYVEVKATRHDLDLLLFGLTKLGRSQRELQQCVIEWSNNRLVTANERLQESQRLTIEGDNEVRQFFAALMASAALGE